MTARSMMDFITSRDPDQSLCKQELFLSLNQDRSYDFLTSISQMIYCPRDRQG